jgi:nickel/cobalt transporter (NicO) family protein
MMRWRLGFLVVLTLSIGCGLLLMAMSILATSAAASQSAAVPTQVAQAQPAPPAKSPFGIAPPSAPSGGPRAVKPADNAGVFERLSFWVTEKQAQYNRELVQAVRRFKTDNVFAAAGALALLSFLYGVFHAVGPGHGKAIISSYVLANERTARRGVLIAFMSSAFQALSAIVIVGVMAILLRATSVQMQAAEAIIERVSYALVMLVGAWLLFVQIRALLTGKPAHSHAHGSHAHGHAHAHDHGHAHHQGPTGHGSGGHTHAPHAHAVGAGHAAGEDCEHCGHQHLPGPDQLESGWSWKRALALSFAVGVRPCTGAILVLVFALTQGLFWAGVFATFAMALGTALTVSALAVLAVVSRDWAAGLANGKGTGGRWMDRIYTLAALAGSGLVFLMGLLLFWGSFGAARPF